MNAAVADALLRYFKDPSQYDRSESTLLTWLCSGARYNALSQLRDHGRRLGRLDKGGEAVRIGLLGRDNERDGEDAFLNALEVKQVMAQHGAEIVTDPGDQEVFLLVAAGTKVFDRLQADLRCLSGRSHLWQVDGQLGIHLR